MTVLTTFQRAAVAFAVSLTLIAGLLAAPALAQDAAGQAAESATPPEDLTAMVEHYAALG